MFQEELNLIKEAVLEAGIILRKYYGSIGSYKEKEDSSLVSHADHEAEEVIFNKLRGAYPLSEFLGEEGGKTVGSSGFKRKFACDPLDGTTNFLYRIPHFCSSVAMAYEGEWVVGVIYNPINEDMFTAIKGEGAFHNDKKMQASTLTNASKAMVVYGRAFSSVYEKDKVGPLYNEFSNIRGVRTTGSAALDLAYVADGRFDLQVCKGLNIWDTAAGFVLLQEAGAVVKNFSGEDYQPEEANIITGSPTLVKRYLEFIKDI